MKVAIVCCALLAVVFASKECHDGSQCSCHHADQVANCENHVCTCVSTGQGKRAEHTCMDDADCMNYDCHDNGSAFCSHHGSAEHGHSLCACKHV